MLNGQCKQHFASELGDPANRHKMLKRNLGLKHKKGSMGKVRSETEIVKIIELQYQKMTVKSGNELHSRGLERLRIWIRA